MLKDNLTKIFSSSALNSFLRRWLTRLSALAIYLSLFTGTFRGILGIDTPVPEVISNSQSWGELRRNATVSSAPLRIHGVRYWTGFGTHASSRIVIKPPSVDSLFSGACGLDDNTRGKGQFSCAIEVDEKVVWNSRTIFNGNPIQYFQVIVNPSAHIELLIHATETGIEHAHANWVTLSFKALR